MGWDGMARRMQVGGGWAVGGQKEERPEQKAESSQVSQRRECARSRGESHSITHSLTHPLPPSLSPSVSHSLSTRHAGTQARRHAGRQVHGCAFPTCRGGWAAPSLTCRSRFPLPRALVCYRSALASPFVLNESQAVPHRTRYEPLHRRVPSGLVAHPAAPATMDCHEFGSFGAIIRSHAVGSVQAQSKLREFPVTRAASSAPPRPAATSVSVIHPAGALALALPLPLSSPP